jgi:purine-binding chemotaxis protein CheW
MEDDASNPENLPPVWDRLREGLERLHAALGRQSDPESRAKKMMERGRLMRRHAASTAPTGVPLSFLALARGRERYGIPLDYVLEVQALDQFSPIPGAPRSIRGVVHWRGAILALVDLTRLFEVAETGLSDVHAFVVVEASGKRLALAATQVDDIVSISRAQLKTVPELPGKIAAEWVLGVHDDNQLILKIDEIFKHLDHPDKK